MLSIIWHEFMIWNQTICISILLTPFICVSLSPSCTVLMQGYKTATCFHLGEIVCWNCFFFTHSFCFAFDFICVFENWDKIQFLYTKCFIVIKGRKYVPWVFFFNWNILFYFETGLYRLFALLPKLILQLQRLTPPPPPPPPPTYPPKKAKKKKQQETDKQNKDEINRRNRKRDRYIHFVSLPW